jgi:hypothetical protein
VNIKDFDFAARFAQVEVAPAPSCKHDEEVATDDRDFGRGPRHQTFMSSRMQPSL